MTQEEEKTVGEKRNVRVRDAEIAAHLAGKFEAAKEPYPGEGRSLWGQHLGQPEKRSHSGARCSPSATALHLSLRGRQMEPGPAVPRTPHLFWAGVCLRRAASLFAVLLSKKRS